LGRIDTLLRHEADPATFAAEEEKLRRLTAATGAKLGAAVSCYCNSTVGFGRI
jgi:3-mercaptopyruvate sulfurtransferase SseA